MKIYGVPAIAREVDIVKEITSLAAEPMVVDELSLIRAGPIRVKVRCLDPTQLRGFVRIFFNGAGHNIKFVVEGFYSKVTGKDDTSRDRHKEKDDDNMDEDSDEDYDEDDTKTEWEKQRELEESRSKPKDEAEEAQTDLEISSEKIEEVQPIACFDPKVGILEQIPHGKIVMQDLLTEDGGSLALMDVKQISEGLITDAENTIEESMLEVESNSQQVKMILPKSSQIDGAVTDDSEAGNDETMISNNEPKEGMEDYFWFTTRKGHII